jgi:hypothetical protein
MALWMAVSKSEAMAAMAVRASMSPVATRAL